MKAFKNFIFYNNTIPIVFGVLFLGTSLTFAASEEARSAVVQSQTGLVSVDNSYLLNTSITDSVVEISILSVTEDSEKYYIEYEMRTISIVDGVWQPTTIVKEMEVGKEVVVGRDLGLYVAEELDEVHALEVRKLTQFQAIDREAGETAKVVATEYSGLVGQFFDPEAEVFPSYQPIISPSVGIPLTREQKAAHQDERQRIESLQAEFETVVDATRPSSSNDDEPITDSNEPASDTLPETQPPEPEPVPEPLPLEPAPGPLPSEPEPITEQQPPEPVPEPLPPEPEPEPEPEPAPEPPPEVVEGG